jgi:hypothetical protein
MMQRRRYSSGVNFTLTRTGIFPKRGTLATVHSWLRHPGQNNQRHILYLSQKPCIALKFEIMQKYGELTKSW